MVLPCDHVMRGAGSPIALHVRVCWVLSTAVLLVGARVNVGGTVCVCVFVCAFALSIIIYVPCTHAQL